MNRQKIEDKINEIEAFIKAQASIKKAGLFTPLKIDNDNLYKEWNDMKSRYGAIASIPTTELGEYLDKWAAMISYTRWVEAVADIEQQASREIRDMVKKQLYTLVDGSRENKDAQVHAEPIFVKWNIKYIQDNSLYLGTKALREGYEQRYTSISREITRRSMDYNSTNRSYNANQKGRWD